MFDPQDFVCYSCQAEPGEPCRSPQGVRYSETHSVRRDKARHEEYAQGLLGRIRGY